MQLKQTKILETVFKLGRAEAIRQGVQQVTSDHLLLGILKQDSGHASHVLRKLLKDWEIYQIKIRMERELKRAGMQREGDAPSDNHDLFMEVGIVIRMAAELNEAAPRLLNTAHLLMAILKDQRSAGARILDLYQVNADSVEELIGDLPPNEDYYEDMKMLEQLESDIAASEQKRRPSRTSSDTQRTAPATKSVMNQFGQDLTEAARQGKLDPVVGRQDEIGRVIQILGRRKKNNPVLIGEPGVGKSAIVEGLALRIAEKRVPPALFNKKVFALDVSSLVAGTKYRGQFEERINALLKELSKNKDIILFIDEIHTIVGAGSTQGSLDTANILKPALARGELQCIGATTLNEYRENIEKDGALERRFQKVMVEQPSPEETLIMLSNIKSHYERHHDVQYTPEAIQACVDLTQRYMTDRFFPDKAIDVMDEAGSRAHLLYAPQPQEETSKLESALISLEQERYEAMDQHLYDQAATLREQEIELQAELDKLHAEASSWEEKPVVVDVEQIQDVVASMTGVPMAQLSQGERDRLKGLNDYFSSVVIGQPEAVQKVTRALQLSRVGLKDPNRPIGVFMFVGPTGVGKTHMAKELARHYFDSDDALVRIDMSEYSEKHNVSRLIGSPPGYVGYGEGGQLTERVRRHPYCVLLFDEIEKAHPDIYNLMLQIFDEGQLTDGLGRKVDFRNTIIIMTSNVGSREAQQRPNSLGYTNNQTQEREAINRESTYRKSLEAMFAPEFINRIDDIVVFNSLSDGDMEKIVELELAQLNIRLSSLGYAIESSDEARQHLIDVGYEACYGVRSLKRTIMDYVEEPLAEMIVDGKVHAGDVVDINLNDNTIQLHVKQSA